MHFVPSPILGWEGNGGLSSEGLLMWQRVVGTRDET